MELLYVRVKSPKNYMVYNFHLVTKEHRTIDDVN